VRIGVVSDTHDHLANVSRIVEILNASAVERVVHTGDITRPTTLRALAALEAPLVGVFGNNDVDRAALTSACDDLGARFVDPPLTLHWAGRRILVTHDHERLEVEATLDAEVLIHGHDHRFASESLGGTLRFNPGECAGHVAGLNSLGILDLATLSTERVRF
jgi:putative phosphoesterase